MLMKQPMVAFLTQLLRALRSRFSRRARLEAENLLLRQQLVVLRRLHPRRVKLWNFDRLLLVWPYRLYPALLDAIIIVQPETVIRWDGPARSPRSAAFSVERTISTNRTVARTRWGSTLRCTGWRPMRTVRQQLFISMAAPAQIALFT
jgi:hypothetical protein